MVCWRLVEEKRSGVSVAGVERKFDKESCLELFAVFSQTKEWTIVPYIVLVARNWSDGRRVQAKGEPISNCRPYLQ